MAIYQFLFFTTIAIILSLVSHKSQHVIAWGHLGHGIIGLMTEKAITAQANASVYELLNAHLDERYPALTLQTASTWADRIKSRKDQNFTKTWHFVDTLVEPSNDSTGAKCLYQYNRDCEDKECITNMITNTVEIVAKNNAHAFSPAERGLYLKFLIHLIQDLHQPLHVSGHKLGGNKIAVHLKHEKWNLHSAWDTGLLKLTLSNEYENNTATYIQSLQNRLNTTWSGDIDRWTSCVKSHSDTEDRNLHTRFCPDQWAEESSRLVCRYVYQGVMEQTGNTTIPQLAGDYHASVKEVIDQQIAKASIRLAAVLNAIL